MDNSLDWFYKGVASVEQRKEAVREMQREAERPEPRRKVRHGPAPAAGEAADWGTGSSRKITAVYQILCRANGRMLVDASINVYMRYRAHLRALRKGRHTNAALQADFDRYKEDAFTSTILQGCKADLLPDLRKVWIEALDAHERGYNVRPAPRAEPTLAEFREREERRLERVQARQEAPERRERRAELRRLKRIRRAGARSVNFDSFPAQMSKRRAQKAKSRRGPGLRPPKPPKLSRADLAAMEWASSQGLDWHAMTGRAAPEVKLAPAPVADAARLAQIKEEKLRRLARRQRKGSAE